MDLALIAAIGLAGSVHCVGMCGGFVVALAQVDSARPILLQLAYYAGKTSTYVVFGVAAGAAGAVVIGLLSGLQSVLSVVLGLSLIAIGLSLLGFFRIIRGRYALPGIARLSGSLGKLIRAGSPAAIFGLGLMNGLLPCGLVYAMLLTAAASGSPVRGAITMLVFGLATIPALVLTSCAARLARPLWRTRLNRVGGILVVILGLLTLGRGIPSAGDLMHPSHVSTEHAHQR